jgi:hypothetical protein
MDLGRASLPTDRDRCRIRRFTSGHRGRSMPARIMSAKGPLPQTEIVRRLAVKAAKRVVTRTIRACRGTKSHLSTSASLPASVWEDICVLKQQPEPPKGWEETYEATLLAILEGEVGVLEEATRWAIWYQTDAGREWSPETKARPKEYSDEYLARFLLDCYVLPAAEKYTNVWIRQFIEMRKKQTNPADAHSKNNSDRVKSKDN